jgi:hypothetical protein
MPQALADRSFIETTLRLHRAGEGAVCQAASLRVPISASMTNCTVSW